VGLRPTWGRVSRHGCFPAAWSMDQIGPLTRTVEDAALVLGIIAGYDPRDPLTSRSAVPGYRSALAGGAKGLRIGVVTELVDAADTQAEVRSAVREAARGLAGLGASAEDISLPLIHFAGAVFNAPVDFTSALFLSDARFDNAKFRRGATFSGVEFRGVACFDQAEFGDAVFLDRMTCYGNLSLDPEVNSFAQAKTRDGDVGPRICLDGDVERHLHVESYWYAVAVLGERSHDVAPRDSRDLDGPDLPDPLKIP